MVETVKYTVLKKVDSVELRKYPFLILASINIKHKEDEENDSFKELAGYIFGSNNKKEKIGMTSPVITRSDEKKYTMSFVMPDKYTPKNLPKAKSKNIDIEKKNPSMIAVLRFSGSVSDEKFKKMKDILLDVLIKNKIPIKGSPFLMRYDSPWTLPFLRRNEIAIEVFK